MNSSMVMGPHPIQMIPIDQIDILNPRERNQVVFNGIVQNIKLVGLKKPITVSPRQQKNGTERYVLICGEGRLKAFQMLGETEIPANVVYVDDEEAFIMSLAENIARRQHQTLELVAAIARLHECGYDKHTIAKKIGLTPEYTGGILNLLAHGEDRLVIAVETGRIPLNAALSIFAAGNDNKTVQNVLQDIYESGTLKGTQLIHARKIIERRLNLGRSINKSVTPRKTDLTPSALVRTYQKEVDRQKNIVRKADIVHQKLLIIVSSLQRLLLDENFITLLRAEGMATLPKYIYDRIEAEGAGL
ncbi:TPA: ParB/RepB/Spo0J family partition protein [Acinetobacter baumannii]